MSEEGNHIRSQTKNNETLSATRRSRQDRNGDNRSSMEGLSQINKISEMASQNPSDIVEMQALQSNPRSMPPKSMSLKDLANSDQHRREKNSVIKGEQSAPRMSKDATSGIAFDFQAGDSQMIGKMLIVARNEESDTLEYKSPRAKGDSSTRRSKNRHTNS